MTVRPTTIVLLHGAGDTSFVWKRVREHLRHPSVAVDMLGRGGRPYDLTRVSVATAARAAAADVRAASDGPWMVVSHSAGTLIAPRLIAELGAVEQLVMVAGVIVSQGQQAVDVVHPERRAMFEQRRVPLFDQYRNHTYLSRHDDEQAAVVEGFDVLRDAQVMQSLDSFNLIFEPMNWAGVSDGMTRVWVRCIRDQIQSREMQDRLIAASGAHEVREIDTGHTPAREDPEALADLLDELAGSAKGAS